MQSSLKLKLFWWRSEYGRLQDGSRSCRRRNSGSSAHSLGSIRPESSVSEAIERCECRCGGRRSGYCWLERRLERSFSSYFTVVQDSNPYICLDRTWLLVDALILCLDVIVFFFFFTGSDRVGWERHLGSLLRMFLKKKQNVLIWSENVLRTCRVVIQLHILKICCDSTRTCKCNQIAWSRFIQYSEYHQLLQYD